MKSFGPPIRRVLALARQVGDEIFDQAAYARYLQRTQSSPSRESYARFYAEKYRPESAVPRCC